MIPPHIKSRAEAWADLKVPEGQGGFHPNPLWHEIYDTYLQCYTDIMKDGVDGWCAEDPDGGLIPDIYPSKDYGTKVLLGYVNPNDEADEEFIHDVKKLHEGGWSVVPVKIIKVGEVV